MRLGRFTYVFPSLVKSFQVVWKQMGNNTLTFKALITLIMYCLKCGSDFSENLGWALGTIKSPKALKAQVASMNATLYFLACVIDWSLTFQKLLAVGQKIRGKQRKTDENSANLSAEDAAVRERKEALMRTAQLAEAAKIKTKFVKISADLVTSAAGVGALPRVPSPALMACSLASALCVLRLECAEIDTLLAQRVLTAKPDDVVRDRSVL
jgi:hypothetical protein